MKFLLDILASWFLVTEGLLYIIPLDLQKKKEKKRNKTK